MTWPLNRTIGQSLGKPQETAIGGPFVQHNQDGRLEVFAIGVDTGEVFCTWQVSANGGWKDGWLSQGKPSSGIGVKSHVVGRNPDGRQEIFAVGENAPSGKNGK